jgi:magnesium transporter
MFAKHNPPIGSRPGTLAIPPGSPPPRITVMEYDPEGVREQEIRELSQLRPYAGTHDVTWVDVRGLGDEATLRGVAEIFGIHPLALEDAVNVPQRAKSVLWDAHQLAVARVPVVDAEGALSTPQVCLIWTRECLITFQERPFGFFDPVRQRIREGIGPIRTLGPDYLVYALVDLLVDRYYPVVELQSTALDRLEDEVIEDPSPELLAETHSVRRDLSVLRRVGWPQREAIGSLAREPSPFVSDEVRVFLRDSHDHMSQIMELVDSSREVAVGVVDLYLSTMSHRTNEVMKMLTLMASIFIPLTFLAGIYGMNFEYMPELHSPGAYPAVLLTMGLVAVAMILFFRIRGWIGGGRRRRRR